MHPATDPSDRAMLAPTPCPTDLVSAARASLLAKIDRLLASPVIASIPSKAAEPVEFGDTAPWSLPAFANAGASLERESPRDAAWHDDPDDETCRVEVEFDYRGAWRGREQEVLDAFKGCEELQVAFLTDDQRQLLERSPREFLELRPKPESAELVAYEPQSFGGATHVVSVTVASPPQSRRGLRHVAIVPNLIQLQRQLDALERVQQAADDGPLAPLRAIVGLCDPAQLNSTPRETDIGERAPGETLDEFQAECVHKALRTPHFAVIQGPPGSGKTTVITSIIRRAVSAGERVLVVSPTHVAVDNVVEKLTQAPKRAKGQPPLPDQIEPHTVPVRFSSRSKKLSDKARRYWVGRSQQLRSATLATRLQAALCAASPFAAEAYARLNSSLPGQAPLSQALADTQQVICGTPIGVLSHEPVRAAEPGEFDLLIVDEVSKLTLTEFLAVAVKARRWVLVGDPQQLPPFSNVVDHAWTLNDVVPPELELVCSAAALIERCSPRDRASLRLVVVARNPDRIAESLRAHLRHASLAHSSGVARFGQAGPTPIMVCGPDELDQACESMSPAQYIDRARCPDFLGTTNVLVQRGLKPPSLSFASGVALLSERYRMQAALFETAANVYHAQPWVERAGQKLTTVALRNGMPRYLPSAAAMAELAPVFQSHADTGAERAALVHRMTERLAVNTVSIYDWLTGLPCEHFDTEPLTLLAGMAPAGLQHAVAPFTGTLKKQYRMHPSLSRVPRELFYFGEALIDGTAGRAEETRVFLDQVDHRGNPGDEFNVAECEHVCGLLEEINLGLRSADASTSGDGHDKVPGVMVITPYKQQEERLHKAVDTLRSRGAIDALEVEVCTLDRCQGREADYVIISLVKGRASRFMDMPKRWNVALTRAKEGLRLVGDIESYRREADSARRHPSTLKDPRRRPQMSLLARVIEEYCRAAMLRRVPAHTVR